MNRAAVFWISLGCLLLTLSWAMPVDDLIAHAHKQHYAFRDGKLDDIAPLVQQLEAAVTREPRNAKLWLVLGHARMCLQTQLFRTNAAPDRLIAVGEQAHEAYERARELDPDNSLALASRGMAGLSVALIRRDGPAMGRAVEDMNAAVREAPSSTGVRLTRAFTAIHMPPPLRDSQAVMHDLEFIINHAPGGRPEDVIHLLLGDVHAELGDLGAAAAEYGQINGASAFALEQARSRIDELKRGAISSDSIARVRATAGIDCATCHAPGADNEHAE